MVDAGWNRIHTRTVDWGVFGLVRKVKDLNRKNRIQVVLTEKGEEAYRRSREMKAVGNIMSSLSGKEKKNPRADIWRRCETGRLESLAWGANCRSPRATVSPLPD